MWYAVLAVVLFVLLVGYAVRQSLHDADDPEHDPTLYFDEPAYTGVDRPREV